MKYAKELCQKCGSNSKLVQTLMDDECVFDDETGKWEYVGFTDDFEHTGIERCTECLEEWTGGE